MSVDQQLRQYVIYYDPRDYPNKFVVRGWSVRYRSKEAVPDSEPLIVADTLQEARALIPPDYTRLPRFREDDAAILEVWI